MKRQFEKILLDIYDKKFQQMNKKINKTYKEAFKSIEAELNKLWLEMLEQGEVNASIMFRLERWKGIQELIQQQMAYLGQEQQNLLQLTLLDSFKEAYLATNGAIGPTAEYTVFNENIAKKIVESKFKGVTLKDRIMGATNITGQQIQKSIIDTCIAGKDFRKVSKELANRFNVSRSTTDKIVRTETMRVLNEAQKQSYKDKGYTTVIWLAELDERVCDECASMDGKEYDVEEAPSIVHPNCRCTCYPKLY